MNKRKKHFAMLRAEEKRRKPPTKAQKRNLMSTYLKNIGGYKHNQLKSKSYKEIQKLFDNEMRRVNTFIPMDSEVVKSKKETEESSKGTEDELESDKSKKAESSEEKAKGSRKKILGKKRAGKEQQQESSKRQRMEDDKETDEHEEVEVDDEAELKKHLVIVKDDEIAKYAYQLLPNTCDLVDTTSKQGILDIDREDLETLWKLVKIKHGDTRPEDEHERVLEITIVILVRDRCLCGKDNLPRLPVRTNILIGDEEVKEAMGSALDTCRHGLAPTAPKEKKSRKRKHKTTELENISEADLTETEQLKIVIKRSRQETHSSHASGSGADEGTSVIPGVPDAPDYDSEDDISWKSSDDDQDDEQAQDDDDADKNDVNETTQDVLEYKFSKNFSVNSKFSNNYAPIMRTASAAAKPCQGDSLKFYLIAGSIYTDQRGTVVIATVFNEVTKTLSSISVDYH
ncbi:hypothetical protein Tco_0543998 [Tanacetum coccineum]